MAMTKREYLAKEQILKKLNKEGYPTYSRLLDEFDVNLTNDPSVIAYMEPSKGRIVLNSGLDIEQVSTITRHEILHQYLQHEDRLLKHLARKENINYNDLKDDSINDLKNKLYSNKNFNIAGDYEISNRGYTIKDKRIARSIRLNGQVLKGLVTEDDHPDWVDLPIEDMYDKLTQQLEQEINNAQQGNQSDQTQQDQGGNEKPQIGDHGDQEMQDAEQAEREANDISKQMRKAAQQASKQGDEAKEQEASDVADKADKIAGAADKIKDKASEEIFDDKESDSEIEARLNRIKKLLNDVNIQAKIVSEAETKVDAERAAAAAKDADIYKNTPIKRFRDNLNKFIKNQIETGRGLSWSRVNKKYSDSGLIRPGSTRLAQTKVPLINVYFDRSASWGDNKTKVGEQAIGTLNQYVQRHEIKINLYYFSENVHSDKASAEAEGNTYGQPILNHIEETKPDNVIVMTDSDIKDCRSDVTVPGAVWFLFKGGRSQNLVDHLHGKTETKEFELN